MALEARLATTLFVRTTRGVRLTPAGIQLASHSRPLMEELSKLQDGLLLRHESIEGEIRLGGDASIVEAQLMPLVARFCSAYPRIRVDFKLTDQDVNLRDGQCHFAFCAGPLGNSGVLVARPFASTGFATLASPTLVRHLEHELQAPLTPQNVPEMQCLAWSGQKWRFRQGPRICVVSPQGSFASNSPRMLLEAAVEGVGMIHIPARHVQAFDRSGSLTTIFNEWVSREIDYHIVYAKDRFMPLRVRLLIDYLLAHNDLVA